MAQQVADLWQIPVRKKIAAAELERTILATSRRGIELAADVRAACYKLIALQRNEAMLREGRGLAERAAKLAHAQFEAGEVSQFDLNLARAALLDVDLEVLALERERAGPAGGKNRPGADAGIESHAAGVGAGRQLACAAA